MLKVLQTLSALEIIDHTPPRLHFWPGGSTEESSCFYFDSERVINIFSSWSVESYDISVLLLNSETLPCVCMTVLQRLNKLRKTFSKYVRMKGIGYK